MAVRKKSGFKWPERFATVGWTGLGVDLLRSWMPVLSEKTGMKTQVIGTPDSVCRFRWLRFGIADMTAGGTTEVSQMLEGDRRYGKRDSGPFQFRAVWAQSKSNSGFFVRGDSPIKTINDIKPGVRAVDMRGYLASQRILEAFLLWSGKIKDVEKEVDWVPAKSSDHKAELVVEGKADVAFAMPSSPSIYKAEKNPHSIRWISLNSQEDPEGARRFLAVDPLIDFMPMFNGVKTAQGVWGSVGVSLQLMRAETDPEFVYNLAKWLDENWGLIKGTHPWNEWATRTSLMEEIPHTFYPLHDGLIEYLKDIGLWTNAMERRNHNNVELVTRYCKANQEAIEKADANRMWVSSKNPEWLEYWESYKQKLNLPRFKMFLNLEED